MVEEHTPAAETVANRVIVERKQKPDGSWREYPCTLLHQGNGFVVIEFVMAKGGEIFGTPITVPPGSRSHGWFWTRRPFNLYRMRDPEGRIIGHRFDAVADVKIAPGTVSYRDLVLDWWVTSDDVLIEEDRDEFDALVAAGELSAADLRATGNAERAIYSRYRHIIDDVAILERRLGLDP